jgi:hypothetical protein
MMKNFFRLLSALLLLGLVAGCGGKTRTEPDAGEFRRQQEEAGMMQDAKESIQRMRRPAEAQSPAPAE